jgi:hypothetical protein
VVHDRDVPTVALVHAGATLILAGAGWVVQAVVYPAFALVPAAAWPRYHAEHSRRISFVVGPPWLVQGATTVVLLVDDATRPLVLVCAVAALAGVLLTVGAVREHGRLAPGVDGAVLRRLLRWNMARSLVWTAGGVAALVLAAV